VLEEEASRKIFAVDSVHASSELRCSKERRLQFRSSQAACGNTATRVASLSRSAEPELRYFSQARHVAIHS
jgi:hypothetical protein